MPHTVHYVGEDKPSGATDVRFVQCGNVEPMVWWWIEAIGRGGRGLCRARNGGPLESTYASELATATFETSKEARPLMDRAMVAASEPLSREPA